MTIGQWVRSARSSKWHVVESVIADEPITRCGRRLRKDVRGGYALLTADVMPLSRLIGQPQLCKPCAGRQD